MNTNSEETGSKTCWFVGAAWGSDNQTERFLKDGIWQNGYQDKYLDLVKSVQPGDRIVIKAAYNQKYDLPFDNRGHSVSVMTIKAIGIVKKNHGDGQTLDVEWIDSFEDPKKWYFYTNRQTIWRVVPGNWKKDGLIDFAFNDKPQDIDRFRNAPYWQERFGDISVDRMRFLWTRFYEAVADALLLYKDRRDELIKSIHGIASKVSGLSNLNDQFQDGSTGPLKDICPFTVMGIFNRGITDKNRKHIASELASFLEVKEAVPDSFEGVPILNNQSSWFFGFSKVRKPDDIDALWEMFDRAIAFTDSDDDHVMTDFISAYSNVIHRFGVGWNVTMGLYWIRPWDFPTLDSKSRHYISKKLNIKIGFNGPEGHCNAYDYLSVRDALETHFQENAYPVHSFPELSRAAWVYRDKDTTAHQDVFGSNVQEDNLDGESEEENTVAPIETYLADNIISDGCFLELEDIERMLDWLHNKKNLILQGPPGTGKTWLARKLAFALIGQKDDSKVRAVQFHPNLSYEDFVRGWRPSGDGALTLTDGPFIEMIRVAENDPHTGHVIVIEEINRGNPAQIFGEMLTLLEADKRTPDEALELSYHRENDERIFIPDNLYVIGTMNIADRSIALVDLALRRRFAFINLKPEIGEKWKQWVHTNHKINVGILEKIKERILSLNNDIISDPSLGEQFCIGHSFVTPAFDAQFDDDDRAKEWFRQVVNTEIVPLLDEYWFDSPDKVQNAKNKLLVDF